MFCKQKRFGTPRTVHHTKSWLKLSFYRSIQIYRVDFEKMYISSMLFFFFFFFFFLYIKLFDDPTAYYTSSTKQPLMTVQRFLRLEKHFLKKID